MAEDWLADVRKYAPNADEKAVAGIVRYCGIALRTRDSSLVSFGDPVEVGRVRDNFLKKKLSLTESDVALNDAIAAVGERMKAEHFRNRVTVYYLLAQHFDKLYLFNGSAGGNLNEPPAEVPISRESVVPAAVVGLGAAAVGSAAAPRMTESFASSPSTPMSNGSIFSKWWLWLLILLAAIALVLLLRSCNSSTAQVAAGNSSADDAVDGSLADTNESNATLPAANSLAEISAAPTGARVVAGTRDGKPMLTVYFDTAKYAVPAEFPDKAADIKAYLAEHSDTKLAVSGFNDPTGDAAFNAELSKRRAQAVSAALEASDIPKLSIGLEKPTDATITGSDNSAARRVEVTVK